MIRLVKRFRLGRGAFIYWATSPRVNAACRGDTCRQGRRPCRQADVCQRTDGVRPAFWIVLLAVFFGCFVIAHWPT